MRIARVFIALCVASLVVSQASNNACAQYGPGTLMQWSNGSGEEGGPDLSKPLVTDRPDFTESSVTVGVGVLQLEGGYTFTNDNHSTGSTAEHSFPELLLRAGMLAEWFELRVGWNWGESAESVIGDDDLNMSGAEDVYLGVKLALTPQDGCLPETGVILQMDVPTGSDDFTAHEVLPGVNYVYGWDVSDFFSVGGGTQANRALDDNGEDFYVEFAQSITTGYGLTEKTTGYAEWFVLAPAGAVTTRNQHYFNAGLSYLITNNIQWDIRAGVGLNEAADDFFTGSGLSVRMY